MRRVSSTEFQKKVGLYQDLAVSEPLTVTRNGRDKIVVLSAEEYGRMKRRDREALGQTQRQGGERIDRTLLRQKQEEIARLPVADDRSADELLEYDEAGLPR